MNINISFNSFPGLILNDDNEVSLYSALSKHVLTEEQLESEGKTKYLHVFYVKILRL